MITARANLSQRSGMAAGVPAMELLSWSELDARFITGAPARA